MRRLYLLALVLAASGASAYADGGAVPFEAGLPRVYVMRPSANNEDTLTLGGFGVGVPSYLQQYFADTSCYVMTKVDTAATHSWVLAGSQYAITRYKLFDGDTLVFKCRDCTTDTTVIRIQVYPGGRLR